MSAVVAAGLIVVIALGRGLAVWVAWPMFARSLGLPALPFMGAVGLAFVVGVLWDSGASFRGTK